MAHFPEDDWNVCRPSSVVKNAHRCLTPVCSFQGERKGVNKYYPPDYDPSKGGLNKFQGTHALRERAKKIHLGILVIRFEMPYNIWCDGCGNHIGMGVR